LSKGAIKKSQKLSHFNDYYYFVFEWEITLQDLFFFVFLRFQTDETSPAIWDPMNPEDYCYDILSKTLIRKTSATTTTERTSI